MTIETNRFVIFEPTMLVALDLEGCLREYDPEAEIVIARSLAEALEWIAQGPVSLAVLHAGADKVSNVTVPMLLIGDAAEERPGSRQVLLRPFSAQDVATSVTGLGIRPRFASA